MSYIYALTDTWNSAPTTFVGIGLNVTNTASAATSRLIDLQRGGSSQFNVRWDGVATAAASFETPNFGITDTGGQFYWKNDLFLARDAANTLAQRNGTNAQAFRVYNTYTDASNYERGELSWSANEFTVGTTRAGTGTNRRLILAGAQDILLHTSNTARWAINGSGHFLALTDNTYDIGASGANRPRNIYFAGGLIGGYIQAASGSGISWVGRSSLTSPSDSIITLTNATLTDFSRLQFGGTTSAFPALKRSSAEMHVRLADDSNYANLACLDLLSIANVRAQVNTAIPAGGTTGAGLRVSSTANFGVFFGSGAPTLSAAKGSLYLRSDGTTTNDRMYVNTDGATTWTAVTTAA